MYLQAVGFFDLLPAAFQDSRVRPPRPPLGSALWSDAPRHPDSPPATSKRCVMQLGPVITDYYRQFFPDVEAGLPVFRACGELISNAEEHGASEIGAFVAAQTHSGETTGGIPRIEFAVCDNGIGVLNSLRRNPRYEALTDDAQALRTALREGCQRGRQQRGNGLYHVIRDTSLPRRRQFRDAVREVPRCS